MTISSDKSDKKVWAWRIASPFSHSVEVNDQLFLSGMPALDDAGEILDPNDIAKQTRHVFENMRVVLQRHGLDFKNLVRLNTYYVFDGNDEDATEYWESMTRVRLEYFADPGPAATAVRIKGMPYKGQLIQIEGIAVKGLSFEKRERIMPPGSWDWSIPVPLSQGWKCLESIYVGGQISADKQGNPVHVGDVVPQTRAIYDFIDEVVKDSGSTLDDVAHLKICFKHNSVDPEGKPLLKKSLTSPKSALVSILQRLHFLVLICFTLAWFWKLTQWLSNRDMNELQWSLHQAVCMMEVLQMQYLLAEKHGLEVKNPGMTVVIYYVKVTTRDKLRSCSIN